jgi:hypothetical protein
MRKNTRAVCEKFELCRVGGGNTVCTDGSTIWSYDMPIAQRVTDRAAIEVISRGPTGWDVRIVDCLTGRAPHVFRRQAGKR